MLWVRTGYKGQYEEDHLLETTVITEKVKYSVDCPIVNNFNWTDFDLELPMDEQVQGLRIRELNQIALCLQFGTCIEEMDDFFDLPSNIILLVHFIVVHVDSGYVHWRLFYRENAQASSVRKDWVCFELGDVYVTFHRVELEEESSFENFVLLTYYTIAIAESAKLIPTMKRF